MISARFGLVIYLSLLILGTWNVACGRDLADAKPTGPFCGMYSLYTALRTEGIGLEFSSLVRPEYVGSSSGSSISEILAAAHDHQAHTEVLTNLSVADLHHLESPAILHVKNGYDTVEYNHFILCVPAQGRLAFYDPPDERVYTSGHELAAIWDGTAIIVSAKPVNLAALRAWALIRIGLLVAVIFAAIGVVMFLRRAFGRRYRRVKLATRLMSQFGSVLGVAILLGLAFHLFAPEGFAAQRQAVIALNNARFADPPQRIDLAEAQQLHSQGALFIDARHTADYQQDHIEGAINIPPDSTGGDIHQWLQQCSQQRSRGFKLVVYCESPSCPFAALLARRLKHDGFKNAAVLAGGWTQWKAAGQKTADQAHAATSMMESGS